MITKLYHDATKNTTYRFVCLQISRHQKEAYAMTQTVYVLIQCDLGSEIDIIKNIADLAEVNEVRGTYGIYDIFCKVTADTKEAIDKIITEKIRRVPYVRSTITLHSIPSQGGK